MFLVLPMRTRTDETQTWANRWGWRGLSPLERHAYYVFWAEIGRRMGIKDIPDSFETLSEWSKVCLIDLSPAWLFTDVGHALLIGIRKGLHGSSPI